MFNILKSKSSLILLSIICLTFHSEASAAKQKASIKKHHVKLIQPKKIPSTNVHFENWEEIKELKRELINKFNYDGDEFDQIIREVRLVESAIEAIKPMPPGKPKNWKVYRSRFVETARVNAGVKFWDRNENDLKKAELEFGVPAEIIVGLIGVETIYGKNSGKYRAIDAITTLAYAYPETPNKAARSKFFRNELVQLLIWAKEHNTDVLQIKASYAGAIGLCQFMPSSLREYAIDFDKDGKIDLLSSEADAIGSVANYLARHGWHKGLPYVFPATINTIDNNMEATNAVVATYLDRGLKASHRLSELKPIVTTPDSKINEDILYGLIDLQNGNEPTEYWLGTENFFAITQYNRSYFYAMSVIDLGKAISSARTIN